MNEALENLLRNPRLWRARSPADRQPQGLASGYPSGYTKLDRHLPGGGWPRHALTEILIEHPGTGELQLLMPALARLSRAGDSAGDQPEASAGDQPEASAGDQQAAGWIAWIAPPFQPYPPALLQWGIELSRLLIVHPKRGADILWAAEQALSSGNCAAVLLWPEAMDHRMDRMDHTASRRLQIAAAKGRSLGFAFRAGTARTEISAAALRLELSKGHEGTDVVILKSRGGRPGRVANVIHDYAGYRAD